MQTRCGGADVGSHCLLVTIILHSIEMGVGRGTLPFSNLLSTTPCGRHTSLERNEDPARKAESSSNFGEIRSYLSRTMNRTPIFLRRYHPIPSHPPEPKKQTKTKDARRKNPRRHHWMDRAPVRDGDSLLQVSAGNAFTYLPTYLPALLTRWMMMMMNNT